MSQGPGITFFAIIVAVALGWLGAFTMFYAPTISIVFFYAAGAVAISATAYGLSYELLWPFMRRLWQAYKKK